MSQTEPTKALLDGTRAYLKTTKAEVIGLLKNPDVADWQHIELDKAATLLKTLGLSPPDIQKTVTDYPRQAKKISKQIADCDNKIANQLADLLSTPPPKQGLLLAQKLEEHCKTAMEEMLAGLHSHTNLLLEASKTMREHLNITAILPLAEHSPGVKRKLFAAGLPVFNLITDNQIPGESVKTLQELHKDAAKLESRYDHLEIPRLPRLAEEILYHYVDLGKFTVKEIMTFFHTLNSRLNGELSSINNIKQKLMSMQQESIAAIIKGISVQAGALGTLITGLYHKRQLKTNLEAVNETLEFLNIYHLTIKNKILPELPQEIEAAYSKVNPVTVSAKKTKEFFVGAKGIIRSVKMMVTSLKGHDAINEMELQIILENTINNCKVYYGTSPKDLQTMKTFIDSLIGHYSQPFPYNDLLHLVKSTVSAYGAAADNYLKNFEIKKDLRSMATVPIPASTGLLADKLKEKHQKFQKANKT